MSHLSVLCYNKKNSWLKKYLLRSSWHNVCPEDTGFQRKWLYVPPEGGQDAWSSPRRKNAFTVMMAQVKYMFYHLTRYPCRTHSPGGPREGADGEMLDSIDGEEDKRRLETLQKWEHVEEESRMVYWKGQTDWNLLTLFKWKLKIVQMLREVQVDAAEERDAADGRRCAWLHLQAGGGGQTFPRV